jgi:multidrug resistance efflux pump
MTAVLARSTPEQRFAPDAEITGEGVRVTALVAGERVEVGTVVELRVEEGDVIGEIDLDDGGAGAQVAERLRGDRYALATQVTGVEDDGSTTSLTTLDPRPCES